MRNHSAWLAFGLVGLAAGGAAAEILLNGQGNQLDLYVLEDAVPVLSPRATAIPRGADGGRDINAQVCRVVQTDGSVRYVAGEDTDQSGPGGQGTQGWGLFDPGSAGSPADPLFPQSAGWDQTGKIVPTYNLSDGHQPEMTGCAVSADGSRLFLVELGAQSFDATGVGSLFVAYRNAAGDFAGIEEPDPANRSRICTLATDLTTAGYVALDDDGSILVPESGRSSGGVVTRFTPPSPVPTSDPGCDAVWTRSTFIQDLPLLLLTPIGIARRDVGGEKRWLVSQVAPIGTINEYDANGELTRLIVPPGEYNPSGLAVSSTGDLYFADLGLRPDPESLFTTEDGLGAIYKVSFLPVADLPLPPVPIQVNLAFPEGLGIFDAIEP